MQNLQFDSSMSPFNQEKLKLLYMRLMNSMAGPGQESESEVSISYCKNCRDKLKNLKFELKDEDIICDFCNNKPICKLYDNLDRLRKNLDAIEFICDKFVPDYKYLK